MILTFLHPDPVKNCPDLQHWSKPVLDPDLTPQITEEQKALDTYGSKNSFRFHVKNMLQHTRYTA
jgi:hypothetical protein